MAFVDAVNLDNEEIDEAMLAFAAAAVEPLIPFKDLDGLHLASPCYVVIQTDEGARQKVIKLEASDLA